MRELKPVMFGKKDVDLYNTVKDMKNFSGYVKRLIREDLARKQGTEPDRTLEDKVDELLTLIKSGTITVDKEEQQETASPVEDSKAPGVTDTQAKTINAFLDMFNKDKDDEE